MVIVLEVVVHDDVVVVVVVVVRDEFDVVPFVVAVGDCSLLPPFFLVTKVWCGGDTVMDCAAASMEFVEDVEI